MLGVVHSSSDGLISYINRNLGVRGYSGPTTSDTQLPPASSLSNGFTFDFLLEAYVARPVEVMVKKTYACKCRELCAL